MRRNSLCTNCHKANADIKKKHMEAKTGVAEMGKINFALTATAQRPCRQVQGLGKGSREEKEQQELLDERYHLSSL